MNRFPSPVEGAAAVVDAGRRLYDKGLVVSTEGNLSIRIGPNRFLTTPAGVCKGTLRDWDLVTVDGAGVKRGGRGTPSTELPLHLAIYAARPDVGAVVHAHPPTATGFAVAGVPLAQCVLPEVLLTVGTIPITPYGTPATGELPERVIPTARIHDAFLLKNHGAVALGANVLKAFHVMEMIESFAKILFTARMLGRVDPLSPEDVRKLLSLKEDPSPPRSGCGPCETCTKCNGGGRKKTPFPA